MPAMAPDDRRDFWPSPTAGGDALLAAEGEGEPRCIVWLPGGECEGVEFESEEELALGCGLITIFSLRNRLQREIRAYCASRQDQ